MVEWKLLRAFVAVAEEGSLTAAARRLRSSQPTLGRQIAELEESLGLTLFERHARGLRLSERGASLYEAASTARDAVDRFERQAGGLSEELGGTVRISASEVLAIFVLPPILAEIRRAHPTIELELVADNRVANLLRRDADVAIRMFRPDQLELIARKVTDAPVGLFAHREYVAEHGRPSGLEVFRTQAVLGLDRDDLHLRALRQLGVEARREDFAIRSDCQPFHVTACLAGLGIAGIQRAIAARCDGLVEVLESLPLPPLPVWLVAHADLHRSARVRAVFDALAAGLTRFYEQPDSSFAEGPICFK